MLSLLWVMLHNIYFFLEGRSAERPDMPDWRMLTPRIDAVRATLKVEMLMANRFRDMTPLMGLSVGVDPRYKSVNWSNAAARAVVSQHLVQAGIELLKDDAKG